MNEVSEANEELTVKERRKIWVTALRSGEYEQTTGALHDETGFCCLGVACDIYLKATGKGKWDPDGQHFTFQAEDLCEKYVGRLPFQVKEWFGLRTPIGEAAIYGQIPRFQLSSENDRGVKFPIIANLIETYEKELFFPDAPGPAGQTE